ncbi:DUF3630 family protein [Aestuariibacter halophilus]|uniref:DUF3630 family protein n=1 Tax=Fluctibacter halophilus TaxID=226011 RepID=A0ABS8GAI6_9ALTE|nr:DUF3630 family protein [Aestuariibacter halophilus]MCC2617570.1 DUF3630 family protein [Aestuariibacter halophilus]
MQQLAALNWKVEQDCLVARQCPSLEVDQFQSALQQWLKDNDGTMPHIEWGADRLQCQFNCLGNQWLLHYETLCNALWIEPVQRSARSSIAALMHHLNRRIFTP